MVDHGKVGTFSYDSECKPHGPRIPEIESAVEITESVTVYAGCHNFES